MVKDKITANAVTPDQLLPYVAAVSGMQCIPVQGLPLHFLDGVGVLVAFAPNGRQIDLENAINTALAVPGLRKITVLATERPLLAPDNCECKRDMYWVLPLPLAAQNGKLRNMLKRASREISIMMQNGKDAWQNEHARLVADFCQRKKNALDEGSIYIFGQIARYLENAPQAFLFSARHEDGALAACAIGDFSAFDTAFYMFAFRDVSAPPGTADLLLRAIAEEAQSRGMRQLNLGLAIDQGVEFFKKKWGASPGFPYVETTWNVPRKSWFKKLFAVQK